MFLCVSVSFCISYTLCSSLYNGPFYFFNLSKLWWPNLNVSSKVLIVFPTAMPFFMSQLQRYLMNRKIMTLYVINAGSGPIAFFGQVHKILNIFLQVSSGHYFLCMLLAMCTSMAIEEYTYFNFHLIFCQLRSLPILFNIL